MNISLLTIFGTWGGAETHTVQLTRTLIERGHTVTVVCLTDYTYALYRERSCVQIPLMYLPIPKVQWKMSLADWICLFSEQPWDTCVLVKGTFAVGSWNLDLAARCCFGNYLTIEHLVDPIPEKTSRRHLGIFPGLGLWWYRGRFHRFFRSVGPRKVVCVSDAVRRRLIEDYRFPARKVVTVRNGIDVQRFRPDPAYSAAWRRCWGVPRGALLFGAVGRLAPMKGYGTALAGFQALLKRFPEKDLRLVLVGEGPHEQALKAQAEQIVPGGRVVFSPFCDRPWEPLNALDVFVMPSVNEGLPLTLLEAMACGCCPVATAVGGIPEVLSKPELGWLVPTGNADAFAAAMIDAASRTPEQRETMGRRAREHVMANFNAAVQFNLLADVIESLSPGPRLRRYLPGSVVPPPGQVDGN
jgi:glycosyltransferase involved in cell wall biosynthesis